MKKILIIGFAMLFSFGIFAQSAEKNAKQEDKDAQDAFDYMDENGIEYEVDYKGAVKELPKDAKMLSVETVIQFLENVVVDVEMSIQFSENSYETYSTLMSNDIENYVYWNYSAPSGTKMVLAGGTTLVGGDGYLYKWERNANNNQSNPGWATVTRDRHCPGGSTATYVASCDETNNSINIHYGDTSESTLCSRCASNFAYSILFSVNPYTIVNIRTYIPGIGWVYVPTRIYMGWTSTLSSGTQVFDPIWNLCSTALDNPCSW